ncbi:hypothetical protein BC833DRAFT_396313 [Globomyces pollinis-pini]|nr:hypothetical protein BC833DRAFT_396313 [Globomyces pollinis-pini]
MGKEELTGQHYGRADLIRMGIFSEPNYVSSGEPFVAKKGVSSLDYRANGKQFLTAPPKRGHDSKDAYFDQHFIRLFENEPYTDLVALRRGWRIKGKEKNITTTPFKPSSVPPKPSGKGSHWGTIEQQWPIKNHKFELPPKPEKNDKKPPELKVILDSIFNSNFVTSPSKKGSGYGYCNVTIGKSYEYQTDPYDGALLAERNSRAANKKKMVGEKPFVSSSTNQEFFNHFAGMSKLPLEKDVAIEKQEKKILVPFKPSSGYGYTINPYPSYELPKGALERPATVKKGMSKSLIFKPSGVTGTYPIRSIIESSCPIAPPTWAKETLRTAMKDG